MIFKVCPVKLIFVVIIFLIFCTTIVLVLITMFCENYTSFDEFLSFPKFDTSIDSRRGNIVDFLLILYLDKVLVLRPINLVFVSLE